MSIEATDETALQKMARSTRSLSGGKAKLLSKVASTVKFVLRANPQNQDSSDPQKRKQFLRQGCKLLPIQPKSKHLSQRHESCLCWSQWSN